MPGGNTSQTRLRLTFNFRTGSRSRDKIRTFASTLVQEVAINTAEKQFKDIKIRVEKQLRNDAFAEIARMAQLYRQYIIGISGDRAGALGTLTPRSVFADGATAATYKLGQGPEGRWTRRKNSYLTAKRRQVGHNLWFLHHGGLASRMGRGATWTNAYGPVRVDVKRTHSMSVADAERNARSQDSPDARSQFRRRFNTGVALEQGAVMRVHVASIRVSAMDRITPQMLPALLSGNPADQAGDGRESGLVGMFPRNIARHLAGSAQAKNFVPYRHTVEPFLGWVLTKAIPNAVMSRMATGLGTDIKGERASRSDKGVRTGRF